MSVIEFFYLTKSTDNGGVLFSDKRKFYVYYSFSFINLSYNKQTSVAYIFAASSLYDVSITS